MNNEVKTIGVIGGLGPLATAKFIEILNSKITKEKTIEYLVINDPTTPDRTAFILNESKDSPLPNILKMVDKLNKYNVDIIVMPCNTASYFNDEIIKNTTIKTMNIVEETIKYLKENSIKTVGVLATKGVLKSGTYKHYCDKYGIKMLEPSATDEEKIMDVIYKGVKANKEVNIEDVYDVAKKLHDLGATKIILGCTELSVLYQDKKIKGDLFIDSMQVLASSAIKNVNEEF